MATPAPLVEHPEVRSAIDLLEAWVEAQRVAHELPDRIETWEDR